MKGELIMDEVFIASLCKNGILGGALYVDKNYIIYRTNKITVPEKYRNLKMPIKDIVEISCGRILFFPTVTISLKHDYKYKFIIFNRKKFISSINELRQSL